jgi:hypothetical protein
LVAGGSGKIDRRIGYFNNTEFQNIMINIQNNTNFLLLLNYIKMNTQCINHNKNELIESSSYSWNNVSLRNTDNVYMRAIALSLEINRTGLHLSETVN